MRNRRLTRLNWRIHRSTASRKDPFWVWSTNTILQNFLSLTVQSKVQMQASALLLTSIQLATTKLTGRRLTATNSDMSRSPISMVNNKSLTIPRQCKVVSVRLDPWTNRALRSHPVSAARCTKSRTRKLQPMSRGRGSMLRTQRSPPCSEARSTKPWDRTTNFPCL